MYRIKFKHLYSFLYQTFEFNFSSRWYWKTRARYRQ